MDKIVISGKRPLYGTIEVSGMKNAALPILYATILVGGKFSIENLPDVNDINLTLGIIETLGGKCVKDGACVKIDTTDIDGKVSIPVDTVKKMRASLYLLGALLGRYGYARIGYPGGCDFGVRPIDQHKKCFKTFGATVTEGDGHICVSAEQGLSGAHLFFDIVSVGATVNAILAAAKTPGVTTIENAAKEPHIVDLANFLNTCGAHISGAGTDTIKIRGEKELHGCSYDIIPDMIEAGTYMTAVAAAGGCVTIKNVIPKHLESITAKLIEAGVTVNVDDDSVEVVREPDSQLSRIMLKAIPYPGFPTDMQPQMCALLCSANGTSYITEGVWANRFRYVEELVRMGAHIVVEGKIAVIEGVSELSGAQVSAVDLRGGAAVVIAALCAKGVTVIDNISLIERGYHDIVGKLRSVGADIRKVSFPD